MTIIGSGGIVINALSYKNSFKKRFKKLSPELQKLCIEKVGTLLNKPIPPGTKFEKLKGHSRPDIYTLHVTGNYKVSFEIEGSTESEQTT